MAPLSFLTDLEPLLLLYCYRSLVISRHSQSPHHSSSPSSTAFHRHSFHLPTRLASAPILLLVYLHQFNLRTISVLSEVTALPHRVLPFQTNSLA